MAEDKEPFEALTATGAMRARLCKRRWGYCIGIALGRDFRSELQTRSDS
jgi:hypothetical protein